MGLLSDKDYVDIRKAVKDVTDTFMVSPTIYHLKGVSNDLYNEDRVDDRFTDYSLSGLVEYFDGQGKEIGVESSGSLDWTTCKITYNLEDLKGPPHDLIDGNGNSIMNGVTDEITVKGIKCEVTKVIYDGPLDAQDLLVLVTAKRKAN